MHAADEPALHLGVGEIGVGRVRERPEAVAVVQVLPPTVRDAARIRRVARPRAVVLQPAVHLVRVLVVHAHVVELRERQVVALPPTAAAVVRDPQPAVVAAHDVLRVGRVDPEVVPVAVRSTGSRAEARATVGRDDQPSAHLEHAVLVLRIHDQLREVERAPHHHLAAIALLERPAAVAGDEERAARALDERVDARGIRWRHGHRHPAPRLGRQPLRGGRVERRPGGARVVGDEQPAATRGAR